jgi:L-rhamnose mutarotase
MTPTTRFRYIERQDFTEDVANPRTIRILQQWWEPERNTIDMVTGKTQGEWRDVPLEVEE